MSDPIAYTYEADHHCEACALARFGRDEHGDITGVDNEGNPVGAMFPWDGDWRQDTGEPETLACGTCGAVLDEYEPEDDGYASTQAGAQLSEQDEIVDGPV